MAGQDLTRLSEQEEERLGSEMSRFGRSERRNSIQGAIVGLFVGGITAAGTFGIGWYAGLELRNVVVLCGVLFVASAVGFWRLVA